MELDFFFSSSETSATSAKVSLKSDENGAVFLGKLKRLKVREFRVETKNNQSVAATF